MTFLVRPPRHRPRRIGQLEVVGEASANPRRPDTGVVGANAGQGETRGPRRKEVVFVIYEDDLGQWRWHFVAANGRIMADSAEGYVSRSDATPALRRFRDSVAACK